MAIVRCHIKYRLSMIRSTSCTCTVKHDFILFVAIVFLYLFYCQFLVAPRSRAHCSRHQHYAVNSASGFISNINPDPDPRDNGYQCPWRIRVLPGKSKDKYINMQDAS